MTVSVFERCEVTLAHNVDGSIRTLDGR